MAGLILLGFIALAIITVVIMLLAHQGKEKILKTLGGFIVVIVLYMLFAGKSCGPNAKDVEIMTPQAEAISNYILKNGIPESLSEIPDLPYKFEGCKRTLLYGKYRKHGYIDEYYEDANKTNAKGELLEEVCMFEQNNRKYDVNIRCIAMYTDDYIQNRDMYINKIFLNSEILRDGECRFVFYNKVSETGMSYDYELNKTNKKWVFHYFNLNGRKNNPWTYSTKDDGMCNPMRM